jgi:5'-deoxynucleotidase YfbR-like HD superfamily hydrolase
VRETAKDIQTGDMMDRSAQSNDGAPARAWQRMLSGRRLDLLNPDPADIDIGDIAHGLARVARWNGQTTGAHAFSVAQHSLLVECAVRRHPAMTERWLLAALLHDAPEYVVGDLISPFKAALGYDYKAFELRLLEAIHRRFALPGALPDEISAVIKMGDRVAAFYEATELAGFSLEEAALYFGDPNELGTLARGWHALLEPWSTEKAQHAFLDRFKALSMS